jgi:hypothetical protein
MLCADKDITDRAKCSRDNISSKKELNEVAK